MIEVSGEYNGREISAEFEVLAPRYMEILDSLSENPQLKLIFFAAVENAFSNHMMHHNDSSSFREMLLENDPDIFRWEQEISAWKDHNVSVRKEIRAAQERKRLSIRSSMPLFSMLFTARMEDEPHKRSWNQPNFYRAGDLENQEIEDISKDPETVRHFGEIFDLNTTSSDCFCLFKSFDPNGYLEKIALIYAPVGPYMRMVSLDDKGKLAIGDEFNKFKYDRETERFTGLLFGEEYVLDGLGRGPSHQEETPKDPSIKHNEAINKLLAVEQSKIVAKNLKS